MIVLPDEENHMMIIALTMTEQLSLRMVTAVWGEVIAVGMNKWDMLLGIIWRVAGGWR